MTVDWKKKLIPNLPYLLFVYLFDKLCQAVRLAPGLDASEKFLHLSQGFTEAFSSAAPSLHLLDLLAGIAGAIIVRLAVYAKSKNTKKYRKGIEYGSARWGTAADIAPYVDPVPDWNIPLTQTEKLTMSSRPKNPKYARNKNILVIGGSGSGKTRFFVKPSLMQMKEKKILYAYGCPSHHNTVTRLKWLTALTVDPEAKRRMLGLARKVETEVGESWYEDFYHHLRMEMDEYRRLKRSLRVLKSYTDYEEDLYEEAV